ncbi:MAG: hypothetical protein M0Z94_12770 [Dehalococcoidales bacterium]|nr:hypothetical protein [Dehalococcoidales bacterium]
MTVTFGPVTSWRLGTALGVDLVYSDHKHCTFDCVYCPQQQHSKASSKRRWYVGMSAVESGLSASCPGEATCIAFAGRGEPTLASNLAESITLAKQMLGLPVAVLTNSSLICRDDVKRDLAKADTVVAKLDAYDEESFRAINRPAVPCTFKGIVAGLREFRAGFDGKLILQIVLTAANKPHAARMAATARTILPDEVQLCIRAPWREAGGVDAETERFHICFSDLNAKCVHTDAPSWAMISDLGKIERLRPNAAVMLMAVAA